MPLDMRQAGVGAAAGFVEACIMHPVDTVKTRMQAQTVEGGVRFTGVSDVFRRTFREEGVGAFYKGIGPVVVSVVPRVCGQYLGLSYFLPVVRSVAPPQVPAALHPSIAGVLTGIVQATVVVAPLELVKNRGQVTRTTIAADGVVTPSARPSGLVAVASDVVRNEGFFGLYRGLTATVLRQCWGLCIKFGGYVGIRDALASTTPNGQLQPHHHMLAGGATNTMVGVLVSPIDVVKTRIQIADARESPRVVDCVRSIVRNEGYATFFRGASMRVLRVAPGGAIQFAIAEYLAKVLGVRIG